MAHLKKQDVEYLKKQFEQLTQPVTLVFFTQKFECQYCQITREIITELAETSDKIHVETYDFVEDAEQVKKYDIKRIPAIALVGKKDYGVRFYGIPAGYEFSTLVEDIIDVSAGATSLSDGIKDALKKLEKQVHIQAFVTPTCPHCPRAVRTAHQMAIESDMIVSDMVEASEFPHLSNRYGVSSVPKVVINESVEFVGALPDTNYLEKVLEAEGAVMRS
ncbi:MAG: protein disulfide oxidoreductase [Candidatus Zhuqueibacterota bacterium]